MKTAVGTWRITSMEAWDADYYDMEGPAHITLRGNRAGEFQFGLVSGSIDARIRRIDGMVRVDFSWSGADENDPMSGYGWLEITGDQARGHIFIHQSEDSAFTAVRQR